MGIYKKDIITRVGRLCLVDGLDSKRDIRADGRVEERLIRLATALDIELLEGPWANGDARAENVRKRELGTHVVWNWEVRGGSDFGTVVAEIPTHKDEGVRVRCGSREPR